jgi:hypothetical protein
LDWLRCIIVMLDLLAQPQSSIPYLDLNTIKFIGLKISATGKQAL